MTTPPLFGQRHDDVAQKSRSPTGNSNIQVEVMEDVELRGQRFRTSYKHAQMVLYSHH